MLQQFTQFIHDNRLVQDTSTVLLSVSGGVDSMVMTHLFLASGLNVAMAHCNFKLRGTESDENETFVRNFAREHDLTLFVKSFDTNSHSQKHGISIQMAARELRRNWFQDLIVEHKFSCYATAHHLDDQIETFFINLLRGTGISGIHGILPRRGNLIHPMLFAYRSEIENYAAKENIPFSADSSNLKTDYERNKIRHELIPLLEKLKPGAKKILNGDIANFRVAVKIYYSYLEELSKKLLLTQNDEIHISIRALSELPDTVVLLFELLKPYHFNYPQAMAIVESFDNTSGKTFYSLTHRLIKDRTTLIIDKIEDHNESKFTIEKGDTVVKRPIELHIISKIKDEGYSIPRSTDIAALDATLIKFPLIIRHWKEGDYFMPLGMNNQKLLSDFFIDNKFSIPQKEATWILESDGEIVWIVGHRIDDRFKVSDNTTQIIEFWLKGSPV